jgi:L-arabinose isomerase
VIAQGRFLKSKVIGVYMSVIDTLTDDNINDIISEVEKKYTIDMVNHPPHYKKYPIEVKEIIRLAVNEVYGDDGYNAYCFGNEIKYRMRAGLKDKDKILEDISKANFYMNERR